MCSDNENSESSNQLPNLNNQSTGRPEPQSARISGDSATVTRASEVADRAALESEKIQLETQLLKRQLSRSTLLMEWLKASAVPIAVLGAAITLFLGWGQIQQSEQNRNADRFDKALSRFASNRENDRLTGVAGLRLFVADSNSPLQAQAIEYLLNDLSSETTESVQSAILDVFKDLKRGQVTQRGLDEVLQLALEENRRLTALITNGYEDRVKAERVRIIDKHFKGLKVAQPFSKQTLDKLTPFEYLDVLVPFWDPFDKLEPKFELPIEALAESVSIFTKLGGVNSDFSKIYCRGCDFTRGPDLRGVNFDGSFLSEAKFTHVDLRGASFVDAELDQTVFFSADLSGANLHYRGFGASPRGGIPILECSNLRGANLVEVPLLSVWNQYSDIGIDASISAPQLVYTRIDSTTSIKSFRIFYETEISDKHLISHNNAMPFLQVRDRSDLIGANFGMWWRDQGSSDTPNSGDTQRVQFESFPGYGPISGMSRARFGALAGYLNQPPLMTVPLMESFDQVTRGDALGGTIQSQRRWKANSGYSCSDANPREDKLIVHIRSKVPSIYPD